jgi:hypothetical protein
LLPRLERDRLGTERECKLTSEGLIEARSVLTSGAVSQSVLKVPEGDVLFYQWYFSPRSILTAR